MQDEPNNHITAAEATLRHMTRMKHHLAKAEYHRDALCKLGCAWLTEHGPALDVPGDVVAQVTAPKTPPEDD